MSVGEQGSRSPQPIAPAKFWLKSALVIPVMGILLAFVWHNSRPKEPNYQGRSLSEWLAQYERDDLTPELYQEAREAIRKIGTNGIPTLLRMIQAKDSSALLKIRDWMDEHSICKVNFAQAEERRLRAHIGLRMLQADAAPAVPKLIELSQPINCNESRQIVIQTLRYLRPAAQPAIPTLLSIASDVKDPERRNALLALADLRLTPETVVPQLVLLLKDPDKNICIYALMGLASYKEASKSAVPELIALLADSNKGVRETATNALRLIDPAAATKAGFP